MIEEKILAHFKAFIEAANRERVKAGMTPGQWQSLLGEMMMDMQIRARKAHDVEYHQKGKINETKRKDAVRR